MSKNRRGGLTGNQEWGKQARKHEDAERGLNNRARIESITEQFKEWWDSRAGLEVECFYCDGTGWMDGHGGDQTVKCGFCEGGVHVLGT